MLRTTEFQGGLNFENSRRWKENILKIPWGGESFDGIPGGVQFLKMDFPMPELLTELM